MTQRYTVVAVVVGVIVAVLVLYPARPETASPTLTQLAAQVDALQATVNTLQASVNTQASDIASLQNKLQFVSVVGTEMYITGANLNIRNGNANETTWGGDPGIDSDIHANGLGNLIVGYNDPFVGGNDRSGSHNIVVGPFHSYGSVGGLVAGYTSTVTGRYASVSGGTGNYASGPYASVSGGTGNIASVDGASISGGSVNTVTGLGFSGSISGGSYNTVTGLYASVSGGQSNSATNFNASVSGGQNLTVSLQLGWAAGTFIWP